MSHTVHLKPLTPLRPPDPAWPSVVFPMDDDAMTEESAHVPPAQPSTGLHILLKSVIGDCRKCDASGAIEIPAGLINVLLEMFLSMEKKMCHLEETIDRLKASVDAKTSTTTNPILSCLTELENKLAGSPVVIKMIDC
ncbi:uncharacterized protein VP01_6910g1 [Puccinia sorghi]|uniref:Uncharacterized protein n=1 Tax=Puccinia sorghi TaxID=27349 RepID=A0A0L6UGB7_9BASI|nr:uncharacterized protein VP01_6910g1 [Puccinia sorghi]